MTWCTGVHAQQVCGDTKLRGVVGRLESRTAIQRDFDGPHLEYYVQFGLPATEGHRHTEANAVGDYQGDLESEACDIRRGWEMCAGSSFRREGEELIAVFN